MFYTQVLAKVATILALTNQIVNGTPAIAAEPSISAISSAKMTVIEAEVAKPSQKTPNRVVTADLSAYTSTPGQTDDSPFIAANGKRVHDGMIAVNGLPFGTIIKIPEIFGDKEFIVEDRMNKRYKCYDEKCSMDIWMDATVQEARKFGRKTVTAEIYLPTPKEVATR
jgi:3D (Asp-Asp-Asp) domain-containing protein